MPFLRPPRTPLAAIVSICLLAGGGIPAGAQEYRTGVFFDEQAQSCVGEIRNFNQTGVIARIYALVPEGTVLNGALLHLQLQPGILLRGMIIPKDTTVEGNLTSNSGVDITLQRCPVATGPILLLSVDLIQSDGSYPGDARIPDIPLRLGGGVTLADSISYTEPQVKICPDDPLGGEPEFVTAPSLWATLNCDSNCPCETSVVAKTWGWVKRLFREPQR